MRKDVSPWRMKAARLALWIFYSIAVIGPSLASLVAIASIVQRDNEHGIATFFGLLVYAPGLVSYIMWMILVRRCAPASGPSALVRFAPAAFLLIGALLVFITLFSPYGFLYD